MKKVALWLLVPAVLAAGCSKDEIVPGWTNSTSTDTSSLPAVDTTEDSEEDLIDNTVFSCTINVVFSESGDAAVSGADGQLVSISGNQVTIDNRSVTDAEGNGVKVKYVLSGKTSNGFLKLYSNNKQALVLNGVSITNPSGAAINNQGKKRLFVVVNGTNSLSDGASAAYTATGDEDLKAVFFSEGQLVFSGEGSLSVSALNAQGKSGITSDDYIHLLGTPAITVSAGSSAGHGIRGKDYVCISSGTLNVTTKADMKKGINSDGYVLVEGGTTTVNVSGGVAFDSEEQEYTGTAGVKADDFFGMTGGSLTITNTGNGGKGIRAGNYDYYKENGGLNDSYISGGVLNVTTTGSESNDVSAKPIRIGFKEASGRSYLCGGNLVISGGTTVVGTQANKTSGSGWGGQSSGVEGLEVKGSLTISGGEVYVTSLSDDAINSQGVMNITGGYIYANSSKNDALDANANLSISGGYVFAVCTAGAPEVAIDVLEGCTLSLGKDAVVVAYGGLESGYVAQNTVYSMSCTAGGWNGLWNGSSFISAFKAPSGISSVAVSAPSLSQGYTGVSVGESLCNGVWAVKGISGGSAVNLTTYSGGSGNPGGNPGGRPGGGGGPF